VEGTVRCEAEDADAPTSVPVGPIAEMCPLATSRKFGIANRSERLGTDSPRTKLTQFNHGIVNGELVVTVSSVANEAARSLMLDHHGVGCDLDSDASQDASGEDETTTKPPDRACSLAADVANVARAYARDSDADSLMMELMVGRMNDDASSQGGYSTFSESPIAHLRVDSMLSESGYSAYSAYSRRPSLHSESGYSSYTDDSPRHRHGSSVVSQVGSSSFMQAVNVEPLDDNSGEKLAADEGSNAPVAPLEADVFNSYVAENVDTSKPPREDISEPSAIQVVANLGIKEERMNAAKAASDVTLMKLVMDGGEFKNEVWISSFHCSSFCFPQC
jgi:hypothetical protein